MNGSDKGRKKEMKRNKKIKSQEIREKEGVVKT